MVIQSNTGYMMMFISFAFIAQVAYSYFKSRKKSTKKKDINEVLMFSQQETIQKKSKYSKHILTPSMDRLLYYLNKPLHSLDICMYVITNQEISNALIKLMYRGVKVRLIVDADMAFAAGSVVRRMEKQGVSVRWMKSTNLMHHKFSLIDSPNKDDNAVMPLVMMGSLNWTNQALNNNWEDVIVTSQSDIVRQYRMEFERLWDYFKPIVEHS